MTTLKPGQRWRTKNVLPADVTPLHQSTRVTITDIRNSHVHYSYTDSTFIGPFCGRDSDLERDFRRMFPVEDES